MQSPTLSIITITYNNLQGLKKTLPSVASLNFKNYEHIIIDGKSTDESLNYLDNFKNHPLQIVSEADNGIYDAMNKGILKAKGDWVIFMNAGDEFFNEESISEEDFSYEVDVLFGDSAIAYEDGFERIMKCRNIESIWKSLPFTHQAVLVKKQLLTNHPFDLNLKYCADFEQLFSYYKEGRKFKYLQKVICKIEAGGVSDDKRHKATAEVYKINKKLNNRFKIHPYFIGNIIKGFLVVNFKKLLPTKLKNRLLKAKYRK
ncbi:glycosyltransferase [Paracrocinitomix mangrovi]|uniref:glycosyltransferase family 2 protein n=1 Tax=Paracrocinitomix mangrovi TaxID=2862509 RepID=UPI001C8E6B1B|nr:glycosyltransferase family 2 protein [Paracrocinitomix mangrovi]UKN01234.1 glycosyltransferase [Paracrocinitomix mangrovi]